ncbi:MAG: hypothetical protein Q9M19_03265 [Mariprofundaceae bacterium]|nr:hypothetical protein [Mariprofundaceae bacterium]
MKFNPTLKVVLLSALLLLASPAKAEQQALTNLSNISGLNVQTSCTTCHTGGASLNPFGADFFATSTKANGYAFTLADWTALSSKDSDADGTDNISEIQAGTNPGGTGGAGDKEVATVGGCISSATASPLFLFLFLSMMLLRRKH